jgi:hypothetical protein
MAEAVERIDETAPAVAAAPTGSEERPVARTYRRPVSSYTNRFRAIYVALALLFWGVVAGGTLIVVRGDDEGPPWSAWEPTTSELDGAGQIATHVGTGYRADDGRQLVSVRVHRPQVLIEGGQAVPVAAVAIQTLGDNPPVYSAEHTLVYELFGSGQGGSITAGDPSVERLRLLRREALELALYTFKYVKGVDSVISVLPPPPKSPQTNWSVFFRKSDLESQLGQPLRETLPAGDRRLTPSELSRGEATTVDDLTTRRWFNSSYVQARDGSAVLLLTPLRASG